MTTPTVHAGPATANGPDYRLLFFSELLNHRVCETRADFKIGKLTDLVFRLAEPFPEAVGIFISHGWGKPSEFIPWDRVLRIAGGAIIVQPPASGDRYPPFVDQPGWILLNEHLLGRTILDLDGRRIEVVNDVQLLQSHGRMIIAHVDVSFNGFLRSWGLGWLGLRKDQLISWKYVQPLSVEDATASDKVSLSVTRTQMRELPSEDLADALEELSGKEQEAMFSALDTEKAAETLLDAEPRAQRQIVADLAPERARAILSEMSAPEAADLLSALPWDDRIDLLALLPKESADRARAILTSDEATAGSLLSTSYIAMPKETTAGAALARLRSGERDPAAVTYIYVVREPEHVLLGVVDLRELVLAADSATLDDLMATPAVSVDLTRPKEELAEMFAKYRFRLLPVVDADDRLRGVVSYKEIMR
ncbi:MAG TPA: CBS domain-containing protein [Gemmatimonadaceae bacterium]|nr:CBS domain-containing protein [Gemmatimonadaceae bacterium]